MDYHQKEKSKQLILDYLIQTGGAIAPSIEKATGVSTKWLGGLLLEMVKEGTVGFGTGIKKGGVHWASFHPLVEAPAKERGGSDG